MVEMTLTADGHEFDQVEQFKYLDVTISHQNIDALDNQNRINSAKKWFLV